MRGARSEGNRIANGIAVERSRAAMRGASSGGGTATIKDVSRGGGLRCQLILSVLCPHQGPNRTVGPRKPKLHTQDLHYPINR